MSALSEFYELLNEDNLFIRSIDTEFCEWDEYYKENGKSIDEVVCEVFEKISVENIQEAFHLLIKMTIKIYRYFFESEYLFLKMVKYACKFLNKEQLLDEINYLIDFTNEADKEYEDYVQNFEVRAFWLYNIFKKYYDGYPLISSSEWKILNELNELPPIYWECFTDDKKNKLESWTFEEKCKSYISFIIREHEIKDIW